MATLSNRAIKAELACRVILLLQGPQAVLAPLLTAVPLLRRLVAIGIVDISANLIEPTRLEEDLAELVTQLLGVIVALRPGRRVGDQRCGKKVLIPEGKGTGLAVDGLDTLRGVALEHEDGVVERRGPAGCSGEDIIGRLLGGDVVLSEIDGEPGVDEPGLLAWWRRRGDACPSREIRVAASDSFSGERADIVEGLGVGRVDGLDSFLDDVE